MLVTVAKPGMTGNEQRGEIGITIFQYKMSNYYYYYYYQRKD